MSFLDTARRAFSTRGDRYDDRYDEDYEDYEDEDEEDAPKKSFFSFLSKRADEEEEYEEEEVEEVAPARSTYASSYSRTSSTPRERYSSSFASRTTATASTPARSNLSGVEVTVHYPASLDDATRIIREVKGNRITLFDISAITSDDEARRVVDYIGGAAFGMECPFERLCPSIFCIAPVGVKIDAKKNKY